MSYPYYRKARRTMIWQSVVQFGIARVAVDAVVLAEVSLMDNANH